MNTPQNAEQAIALLSASLKLNKRTRELLAKVANPCPPCDGTRRGAARRSAWFRACYALDARGMGSYRHLGGDCFAFFIKGT